MNTISIVINTLNRATFLINTLKSFSHLDYKNFEVIVVNGPSTDETDKILEGWRDKIKIGTCPEANLSMSRNIGIAMASGDIVAFIDDDAIPEPEWLDQIIIGFDSEEVAAAGGKVFDHTGYNYQYQYANANRLGHGKWKLLKPFLHYCYPGAFEFPYLQGTNTAFRKTALLEIGGFDEEFVYYLDETDVCLRLIDKGYIVKQFHNAYVHHKYAPSHIRTKSTAIYRYPVLKSKVYFSNRHAINYCSQQEIDNDNLAFMQNHRNDVVHCCKTGRLTEEDLKKFEEHVLNALQEGKKAAIEPPKLISNELLNKYKSDFKKFISKYSIKNPLTIVLLCEDYPPNLLGGIARFTQDKATALANLGHKVHVVAKGDTHNRVDFEDGVWVHRIVSVEHYIPDEYTYLNIPQSHWNQSKSFLDEIDRISLHREIDIVEAPIWNIVGIAPLLSKRYRIITSLMTTLKLALPSRPDLTNNKKLMSSFVLPLVSLEKYMITESDAILAISRGIADEIMKVYELTINKDRLFISYLGMPDWTEKFQEASKQKSEGTLNILFVGRLEKRKGIDLLLEIAPAIIENFPQVRFHIVGDDKIPNPSGITYRQYFEQHYNKLCDKNVYFYGKVDEISLREHYALCDIFVAPSRFESFGLIYVEAMMFGKPVIGCNVGGIPEVIKNEINGLLIAVDDKNELYQALKRLIINQELRDQLGKEGRLCFENNFTAHKTAKEMSEIYNCILNKL